jgi:hypothetical protein
MISTLTREPRAAGIFQLEQGVDEGTLEAGALV